MNKAVHVYAGKAAFTPSQFVPGKWRGVETMSFDAIEATTAAKAARAMTNLVKLTEGNVGHVWITITKRDGKKYTGFQPDTTKVNRNGLDYKTGG